MKRYSIWIDDDTLALLDARAAAKDMTTAKLVRQVLDRYIGSLQMGDLPPSAAGTAQTSATAA